MKFRLLLTVLLTTTVFASSALAQKSVQLPLGDLVAFGGAECGQIGDSWVAGVILGNGKFLPLSSKVTQLKKKKKAAKNKGLTKKVASLNKQIKSFNNRIVTDAAICLGFDIGVTRPTTPQSAAPGSTEIQWSSNLVTSGQNPGDQSDWFCPPSGNFASIWGSFTYTSDSSICYAAVQVGLITMQNGGNVRTVFKAGQDHYLGMVRNSVVSSFYPSFTGSFAFIHPTTGLEIAPNVPVVFPTTSNLTIFRGEVGLQVPGLCPANGTIETIWGTDTYTDDSEICTSAVHAGKIGFLRGGVVTPVVAAGLSSYIGSTRNGVTSSEYPAFPGSYTFN